MPEGHTIHRHARLQRRALLGRTVRAWSPQGRFADGAARLDGGEVLDIAAHGKHLLYRWGDGGGHETGDVLHVHLGLFGRFRTFTSDAAGEVPPPTDGTRLALQTADGVTTIYLTGATVVEVLTAEEAAAIPSRLGPDPLDRRADPARFAAALNRRTLPVVEALLDQKVIAGIGNVYRSELLFRAGIDPSTPADQIGGAAADVLWTDAVHLLTLGERAGRIVSVEPGDVGRRRRSDLPADQQRYVYKRDGRPCHRCGDTILSWTPRSRLVWACPTCQALGDRPG